MPARAFSSLGGLQGVGANPKAPYSNRGKDQDRVQNFVFECDPADPFTGTVELQISNEESPVAKDPRQGFDKAGADMLWVTIVELDIVAEGGTFNVQTEVEASAVRVNCTAYTGGRIAQVLTMR